MILVGRVTPMHEQDRITRLYELLQENGPSVFVLVVGPLLVISVVIWWIWRRSPRTGKLLAVVVIFVILAFVVTKSVSPAGKYLSPYRGGIYLQGEHVPDEWIELSGGVYYVVGDGDRYRRGSYFKKDGHWILQLGERSDGGFPEWQLKFSVLGIVLPQTVDDRDGHERVEPVFARRRIIPFARPDWIPKWLE